ncbi:uncharacterized protein TNCV_42851 [Trichonephila clavipes]|nr:uncharacterized protein TNCV_42851 [Trichonephila clavipes]
MCHRFGHSQTSCRGQLTCSRCVSVGHASSDYSLELKFINCSQPHSTDSKICSKWKTENQIQEIKTNKNISYLGAQKLIVPQLSQTYAQAAKPSTTNNSTQTDENITKIKCPPLNLLRPLFSLPKSNTSISTPAFSTSSSSTQAQLLPSTSSIAAIVSEPQPPILVSNAVLSTINNIFTPIESSPIVSASSSNSGVQPHMHLFQYRIPNKTQKLVLKKEKNNN